MKRFFSSLGAGAVLLASSVTSVLAATPSPVTIDVGGGATDLGRIGALTIPALISGIIRILVIAAAVIFFIWLVIGGIRWIVSGGDKAKTEEARNQITAALIGLVVVFSAWAIARLIETLFGVNLFGLEIKSF